MVYVATNATMSDRASVKNLAVSILRVMYFTLKYC